MEAWRPLLEDSNFNCALSEWTVLSEAWANEWQLQRQAPQLFMPEDLSSTGVWPRPETPWPRWGGNLTVKVKNLRSKLWNPPTHIDLKPGQTVEYALKFVLGQRNGGPRGRD